MIFVDTGAWYASVIPDDINHTSARQWLDQNSDALCTSDYIVDEVLTLLKARGYPQVAIEFGKLLFAGQLAQIVFMSQDDIEEAWEIFRKFDDKDWSFTDCASKALIEKLGIAKAFSFDQHFRQFGSVQVVP